MSGPKPCNDGERVRVNPRKTLGTAISIALIGAAAAGSGAFAAGGARIFGSPVAPPVVSAEGTWSTAFDATVPWRDPEPATLPLTALAIPLTTALITRPEESTLSFAPQGMSTVDGTTGSGPSWILAPRAAATSTIAAPITPATMFVAPLSLPSSLPVVDGLRFPSDDRGQWLAQSPPDGDAAAAPTDEAREADLAKQLANPVSSLISVPFQQNIQFGIGPANAGWQDLMNIQPVVPFGISADWNLVARMIMPVTYQDEIFPGAGSQFGIGDTTFQFFFSPKAPTKNGVIWGIGPLFFVPSGSYLLSTSTWGAGVAAVALKQVPKPYMGGGIFTYGALVTQLWPVSGAAPINSLFLQPFVSYTLKNSVTFNFQTQTTYNWTQSQWMVPLILSVSKVYKFGGQLTSLAFGLKYYPVRPVTAPQWGVQLVVTLLFPKK